LAVGAIRQGPQAEVDLDYGLIQRTTWVARASKASGTGKPKLWEPKSEHTQLDCDPDPALPALRASSASFVKIFFPAMRPDSQAPVI